MYDFRYKKLLQPYASVSKVVHNGKMGIIERIEKMYKKGDNFVKFPNDFFYDSGKILKDIGGTDSFILYSLLTSRKTTLNKIHITLKDIGDSLNLDKNTSRTKNRVVKSLKLLKLYGYIGYDIDFLKLRVTDTVVLFYIDRFTCDNKGWIPFYTGDFEIYYKIGSIPYIVSWILRMYINHNTKTSFIAIGDIVEILKCSNSSVQNAINLFRDSGLFTIEKGDYYFHPQLKQKIRHNNSYKFNYNINEVLNMTDNEISLTLRH